MSDFTMFYARLHQLSPIDYLPMQMIHQIISQANAIKKVHSR